MSHRFISPFSAPFVRAASTLAVATALLGAATVSQAAVITSLPDATTYAFSPMNRFTAGPVHENGMTFTSTTASAVYGYNSTYGLASNGQWSGNSPYIGLNTTGANQFMTLTFDDPVASVLSFLDYAPGSGSSYIAVYDGLNHLIESFTLNIATPGGANAGANYGFSESSNIIKSIRFGDQYIVARDIRTSVAAVPIPGTLPLIGLGIAGLAIARRRSGAASAMPTVTAA